MVFFSRIVPASLASVLLPPLAAQAYIAMGYPRDTHANGYRDDDGDDDNDDDDDDGGEDDDDDDDDVDDDEEGKGKEWRRRRGRSEKKI